MKNKSKNRNKSYCFSDNNNCDDNACNRNNNITYK